MFLNQKRIINKKESNVPKHFIFGELFELAAYVGIYKRVNALCKQGFNIQIIGLLDITDTSNININSGIPVERAFTTYYGVNPEELVQMISRLDTENEAIVLSNQTKQYRQELEKLVELAIKRNTRSRSGSGVYRQEHNYDISVMDFLKDHTDMKATLLIHSGYYTGQYFVDWCADRYNNHFAIILEGSIPAEIETRPLFPDIILVKDKEIKLVADLKSYLRFISSVQTNMLKDVLSQIPVYGLNDEMLEKHIIKPRSLSIHQFVSRYNFLLRYFKILRYLELVYLHGHENMAKKGIDGLILFPTKPVLLHLKNKYEVRKYHRIFENMITYTIRSYNNFGNIEEHVMNIAGISLSQKLKKGDFYINEEKDKDKGTILYSISYRENEQEVIHTIAEYQPLRYHEIEKKGIIKEFYSSCDSDALIRNKQYIHETELKEMINDAFANNNKISVIFDGSSQGIGKNFSFSTYIRDLIKKQDEKSILFVCPRKETLRETIEKLKQNLEGDKIKLNLNFELLEENYVLDFNEQNLRIAYIRSDCSEKLVNKLGKLYVISKCKGESATKKLNTLLALPKQKINVVFVTSATLPSFLYTLGRGNNNVDFFVENYKKIAKYFDMIIFDELTNSSPELRETFIDLLHVCAKLSKYIENCSKKLVFLVLDASLTSKTLLQSMLEELLRDDGDYFRPFSEQIVKEKNNKAIWTYRIYQTTIRFYWLRHTLRFPLTISAISVGCDKNQDSVTGIIPFDRTLSMVNRLISEDVTKIDSAFPSIEENLRKGQVLIYVDNKQIVNEIAFYLQAKGYPVSISTAEEKNPEYYRSANVIGTNSLAFGTSFPNKRLLLILPPAPNVEYYMFRQNIEMIRQIMKRMRGGNNNNVHRLVIFIAYPTKTSDKTLEENVSMTYFIVRNYIKEFVINDVYHQLPSFSSLINSKNWIDQSGIVKNNRRNSIYFRYTGKGSSLSGQNEREASLEYILSKGVASIKNLFNKWGIYVNEHFDIYFDPKNIVKGIPMFHYLCFSMKRDFFARSFKLKLSAIKGKKCLNLMKAYLGKPIDTIKNDLTMLYNLSGYTNKTDRHPEMIMKKVLHEIVQEIETTDKTEAQKNDLLCRKLEQIIQISSVTLEGTAFLLSYELGETSKDFHFGREQPNVYDKIRDESKYRQHLITMGSPFKSLYYGASNYYETPVTVYFHGNNIKTVGFLVHHPSFISYHHKQSLNQLLRKCLLKELFRENYIFVPHLLRDISLEENYTYS